MSVSGIRKGIESYRRYPLSSSKYFVPLESGKELKVYFISFLKLAVLLSSGIRKGIESSGYFHLTCLTTKLSGIRKGIESSHLSTDCMRPSLSLESGKELKVEQRFN